MAEGAIRWVVAIGGAVVVFGAVIWAKGVSPVAAYQEMFAAIFASGSLVDILIKSTPIILAALAVAVPARAGLINVGGEGQLVLGGVAAAGVVRWLGEGAPSVGHADRDARRRGDRRCAVGGDRRCAA